MEYSVQNNISRPLADKVRPSTLDDVFGQEHILSEGKVLRRMVQTGNISNMIFYGPPGTGKTTVANIIAKLTNKNFYKLNATNASVSDIKEIISELDNIMNYNGVVLYLDEIQNFNKKQQQSLLEFMENGKITLIASTTENPYFYIYKAIISRSTVFEFKPLRKDDILRGLKRAVINIGRELDTVKINYDDRALEYIAEVSGGDMRRALNALQLAIYCGTNKNDGDVYIDIESAMESMQTRVLDYDKFGDSHYDILSAFQKSIRGSDPDAAIHYLARLIEAGDLISICRRLLVIASEDVGLAYPNAVVIVKSCIDAAMSLGFPEARIPLSQAVLVLSTAPKSNSAVLAIDRAIEDIKRKDVGVIPSHLKDSHYHGANELGRGLGYKYPHSYENNYIKQQYLPDNIKNSLYYVPGNNKMEEKIANYMKSLKNR